MADADEDRGEAVFWYLALMIENLAREGINKAEIARRTGIRKAQLSQITRGHSGGGILTLIRIAKLDGRTPGRILDDALAWWPKQGIEYRAERVAMLAREKLGEPESSSRPSSRVPA